jgi:hypothetical protein
MKGHNRSEKGKKGETRVRVCGLKGQAIFSQSSNVYEAD